MAKLQFYFPHALLPIISLLLIISLLPWLAPIQGTFRIFLTQMLLISFSPDEYSYQYLNHFAIGKLHSSKW